MARVALGFTMIVYRLPPELRHGEVQEVVAAVRENPPPGDAKVAQWDAFGSGGVSGPDEHTIEWNHGYPNSCLGKAGSYSDRCPDLDPEEWVMVASWDMS